MLGDFINNGYCVIEQKWPAPKEAALELVARDFRSMLTSDSRNDKKYKNFICRDKDQLRFDFALQDQSALLALFDKRYLTAIKKFAQAALDEKDLSMQVRVFASLPGARSQTWHRDTPRNGVFEAMNFFILLNEPNKDLGLTEIVPGSHLKGHRITSKKGDKPRFTAPNQVLVFDYAALHRGLPNWSTNTVRNLKYNADNVKAALAHNEPVESKLNVVLVVSNPMQFRRRFQLASECMARLEQDPHVSLFVLEVAYQQQPFAITDAANPHHLQLRTSTPPLWIKENMVNLAVERLLPHDWKAFAWVDADVEFENCHFATDTLRLLNNTYDVVQLFSHADDLDECCSVMTTFTGFAYQNVKHNKVYSSHKWHPGYAWACTRTAYKQMGGLYEPSILGSGDHIMALSLVGCGQASVNQNVDKGYKQSVSAFQKRAANLTMGYVPGVLRHYFHGSKKFRRYNDRWQVLVGHKFDPRAHVVRGDDGLLVPTQECPQALVDDILAYFQQRNEDEFFDLK